MTTQPITSGSVTYIVCGCGNIPEYCKCAELTKIQQLERENAGLRELTKHVGPYQTLLGYATLYIESHPCDDPDDKKCNRCCFLKAIKELHQPPAPNQEG